MSFIIQYLQYGVPGNVRVTSWENDDEASHVTDIHMSLAEDSVENLTDIWHLICFELDRGVKMALYHSQNRDQYHPQDGDLIRAYYVKGSKNGGTGRPILSLLPYILGTGFIPELGFVKFSEPASNWNSIYTDTINNEHVNAEVDSELAEFSQIHFFSQGGGGGWVDLYERITKCQFKNYFVLNGEGAIQDYTVTVNKGNSFGALVLYEMTTSTSFVKSVPPAGPNREWDIWRDKQFGPIIREGKRFEYVDPKVYRHKDPKILKEVISFIDKQMQVLDQLKTLLSKSTKTKSK
jgi:hypothetical protein